MSARHLLAAQGEEFHAPGTEIFEWGPLWDGAPSWVTKPTLIVTLSVIIVVGFFWAAFNKPKLVPRGVQNVGEVGYLFVRDQIARPMIGKDGDKWVPFLLSTFFFVLIMNWMGVVPFMQLPGPSHIAFAVVLAIFVYLLMWGLSIKNQGLVGWFKNMMFPPGLPKGLYFLYAPIELLSTLILRPFTHSVRLFANMFAGHLLIAFFASVAWWFLAERVSPLGLPVGILGFLMTVVMTGFEIFIQALQAFIFALLAASYIGGALHPDH